MRPAYAPPVSAPGTPYAPAVYGPNRDRGAVAHPGARLAARIVDALLASFVLGVVLIPVAGGLGGLILGLFFGGLINGLVVAPLLLRRRGAHNGQSLGKQLLGVRVVRSDGGAVSGGTAASREMLGVFLLGLVPFYGLVDALMVPIAERGRSIHDRIADTLVIRVGAEAPHWTGRPTSGPTAFADRTPAPASASGYDAHRSSSPGYPAASRPATAPAAGWFPDPGDPSRHRWWDGTAWTEHVG